ncbi:MAG: TolC family protein [Flavobacteriales bacterium]|nr:TolC family protein [Flavobacteriales bacterium]
MKNLIIIAALLSVTVSNAQEKIDNILTDILKNNKSIIANHQFWEAKKLLYKTGLNPENPKFEYENLRGNNGNQVDYYIVQSFDFPTAYIKKNQVANRQVAQSNFKEDAFRQDILLKAKQYCLTLIFLNKKQTELTKRSENASEIHKAYQQKLANGDANILDVNKAKLQLLNAENSMRINQSEIDLYNQRLTELNGGISVLLSNNTYPLTAILPAYETLEAAIEEADPNLKSIHQQNEIDQKKLELSRAMSLPKFEGGYRSQDFAGQTIQGIHLGITIPLWENKNKVKHQKAHLKFNDLQVIEHQNEHHNEIKQLYQKYTSLSIAIDAYKKLLSTVNNNQLLNKALNLGEISSLQYFMELNYYYDSYDTFLDLENDYHQVIAELYKYQL